ncbi:MAG: lipocalin family protein [bacterium]
MNRQRWWFLLGMMVALLMMFTACDQLLNPDDNKNGVIGPVDQALVGNWVLYSSSDSPENGDYYAGIMVNGDGTGTHYSIYFDNEGGDTTWVEPFLWTAENGVLTVQMSNPRPGEPAEQTVSYTVTENGNRFTIINTGNTEVYIKMASDRDAALVGDWIVVSPTDEAGAQIALSSGGTGSYTSAHNAEVTNFTWATNGGYVGLLLYNNIAGFASSYSVSGDQVTMTMGDGGTMVLQRDTGGGTINEDLVGAWFLYSMDTGDASSMSSRQGIRVSRILSGTSEVVYSRGGTLFLNDDGTGSFKMWEDDGMGNRTLLEETLAWEEVVPGLLHVTVTDSAGVQDMQIGYTLDGDDLTIHVPETDGESAMDQTFIKFTDNRPAQYLGTFIMSEQYVVEGPQPDSMPYLEMTLVLNADDGIMYQRREEWDDVNQQTQMQESADPLVWSVSGDKFLQADPTTMIGQVVPFSLEELSGGSAILIGSTWESYWDQVNQTEVMFQVATKFYRFSGENDSDLAGLFVAYGAINSDMQQGPGPQMNLSFDPSSGVGRYLGMEYDEQQQQDVLKDQEFDWTTSNGKMIVLPHTDGYPFGQVMDYSVSAGNLSLMDAGPDGETVLLVKKTGGLDDALYGAWSMVGYTENGTPMDPDPNGALVFNDDGSGAHTGTSSDDGVTVVTDNFSWSVNGDHDKIIVDLIETFPDPEVEFYMVVEYSISGNLFITTYEHDEYDNVSERVEEYQKQ